MKIACGRNLESGYIKQLHAILKIVSIQRFQYATSIFKEKYASNPSALPLPLSAREISQC